MYFKVTYLIDCFTFSRYSRFKQNLKLQPHFVYRYNCYWNKHYPTSFITFTQIKSWYTLGKSNFVARKENIILNFSISQTFLHQRRGKFFCHLKRKVLTCNFHGITYYAYVKHSTNKYIFCTDTKFCHINGQNFPQHFLMRKSYEMLCVCYSCQIILFQRSLYASVHLCNLNFKVT